MDFKPDLDKALERLSAFWEQECIDRACVSLKAPKVKGFNISPFINEIDFGGDEGALKDYWTNPETILKNRLKKFEQTYFGAEGLPAIFQNYGTSGHCNYYGSVPIYGQDTIWFDPCIKNLSANSFIFRQDILDKHLAITKYLVNEANGRYFVAMPDSCGTLDAICHLYGSENVLTSFYDDPDALSSAIKIVNKGWANSCEQFYQAAKENCNGSVHAWMDLWAPKRTFHMQCDLSVMLSPALYEEFVLPELEEQIKWIDYPVYHFDGVEQERHLDYILGLKKLRAVQWTYVAGQPSAAHFLHILKRIQAAGKSLIVMAPPGDIPALLDGLSSKGLYLHCDAQDEEEARSILRYVEQNSRI